MHGTNKDADRYRDEWAGIAAQHNLLLIVPQFTRADFPYGTKNTHLQQTDIVHALAKPLHILLGEADNDPNHKSLRRTPEAMLQGPHRFARGHFYFDYAKNLTEQNNLTFNWHLQAVTNVGHSNRLMANAAINLMVVKKVITQQ
jgi:hypothetical protein